MKNLCGWVIKSKAGTDACAKLLCLIFGCVKPNQPPNNGGPGSPANCVQVPANGSGQEMAAAALNAIACCADYVSKGGSSGDCPPPFSPFIFRLDPSGTVVDKNGNPIAEATTSLLRSETEGGPFVFVPGNSPLIEPNINPQKTGPTGTFAWNVAGGYYEVTAEKAGCTGSPPEVLEVPPPRLNLKVTLACASEPEPPKPAVSSVEPAVGPPAGGVSVTITGSGLEGATRVSFGTAKAKSFTVLSPNSISAVAPAGAGTVDVQVETARGTSAASGADKFDFLPPPAIRSLSPESGPSAGGNIITVTGTGLSSVTSATVGGASAAVELVSEESLKITAPSAGGTAPVIVASPPCNAALAPDATSCGSSNSLNYSYVGGPTISKVSPNKTNVAGRRTITITGTKFTGATVVKFGQLEATSLTVKSATTITAVAPIEPAGQVEVRVTTPEGTSAPSSKDRFKFLPTVTGLGPAHGSAGGGTVVTVTGSGFEVGSTGTVFKFGTAAATGVDCTLTTTCTVTTPAHAAGNIDVKAIVNKQSSAKNAPADQFTFE